MTISLNVEKRTKLGKLDFLRKDGFMPAVFYGRQTASMPIQIKKSDFVKTWRDAGESTVIKLVMQDKTIEALIKEVDFDPIKGEPRHADFYVFEKGHKVEISLPIEFVGVSLAVKELGGILVKVMHELNIEAEPSNLPHKIDVDISSMDSIDSQILVKDIVVPKGVKFIDDPEEVVALVTSVKEEKEEEGTADLSQIEVEKKGKKDEGESEGNDK